ncbi:NYN domain-containing protein [Micromonospora krabiensis]|uniref:NYN domain-containing protein n=1 Tax=Micromonospora krabiensis TaxID=307121 RepID=UPI0036158FA9
MRPARLHRAGACPLRGERFAPSVEDAITNTLIARFHKTRTAKEQADLVLAVLAMDHIHAPGGAPGLFLLATGDQDFIPLVDRMIDARADVILVVASTRTLSPGVPAHRCSAERQAAVADGRPGHQAAAGVRRRRRGDACAGPLPRVPGGRCARRRPDAQHPDAHRLGPASAGRPGGGAHGVSAAVRAGRQPQGGDPGEAGDRQPARGAATHHSELRVVDRA